MHKYPWDLRGPRDERPYWNGQKMRPNGRYANAGSFKAKVAKIYKFSRWDWHYSPKNPNGALS